MSNEEYRKVAPIIRANQARRGLSALRTHGGRMKAANEILEKVSKL